MARVIRVRKRAHVPRNFPAYYMKEWVIVPVFVFVALMRSARQHYFQQNDELRWNESNIREMELCKLA